MEPALVQRLLRGIEEKDASTAAHTWRVTLYARALAEEFGIDDQTMRLLTHGAALHDVGKIDIPASILTKPGRLTDEEFEVIKQHPVTGYARLVSLDVTDEPILNLVKHHHERWDGLGYPFLLKGEEIPLGARFFAVIDTFDALTSIRPYRREVGVEAAQRAIEEIEAGAGTRYWPDAVDAFARLYRTGRLDWILTYFNDEARTPDWCPDETERRARGR